MNVYQRLSPRDRLFWGSVGLISIMSLYFMFVFVGKDQYNYSGFREAVYKDRFSIMVPPYLLEDDSLHASAQLAFSDFSNEVYLMVIEERKRDLQRRDIQPFLQEYFHYLGDNVSSMLGDAPIEELKDHHLGSMHVVSGEFNGHYGGVPVFYILSTYESEQAFYQVRGWTAQHAKNSVKKDLYASIQSFRLKEKRSRR